MKFPLFISFVPKKKANPVMPPVPVTPDVPTPAVPSVIPTPYVPNNWMKTLPQLLTVIIGPGIGAAGLWIQQALTSNPDIVADYGWLANIPGVATAASGFIVAIGGAFMNLLHLNKTEQAVKVAEACSPVTPEGEDPLCHSLACNVSQAMLLHRAEDARDLMQLYFKLKAKGESP